MISMEATRASAQAIVGVPGGAELLLACIFFWVNDWLLEAILSSSRISSVGELIWWLFLASVYVLSWIGGVASIFSKRMFPLVLLIASILAVKGFGGIYDAGYVITSSGLISFVGACAASFFLWTVYLGIGLIWWLLYHIRRWPYLQTLIGLVAIGGLSHLVLDVISHGTPLLYPVSMIMFGVAPERVVEIGVWAYVTDPIFLLEPFLLTLAAIHWSINRKSASQQMQRLALIVLISGLVLFSGVFLLLLPILQRAVANL